MENKNISSSETRQFCTFRLGGRLFGVDIMDVREITRETACTPIAHAPEAVTGYLNLRGQINLIVSLRKLLGFDAKAVDNESSVVLFKSSVAESFGVVVDKIGDIVQVPSNQIEERRNKRHAHENVDRKETFEGAGMDSHAKKIIATELTSGICKLNKELLVVLDSHKILPAINQKETSADSE